MLNLAYVNACARMLGEKPFSEPTVQKLMRLRSFAESFPALRDWRPVEFEHSRELVLEEKANPYHDWDIGYGLTGTRLNRVLFESPTVPSLHVHTYPDVYLTADQGKFAIFRQGEILGRGNSVPVDIERPHCSADFTIEAGGICGDRFSAANPAHLLDHIVRGLVFRDFGDVSEDRIFIQTGGSAYAEFVASLVLPNARRLVSRAVYFFKQLSVLSNTFGYTGHPLYYLDATFLRTVREAILGRVAAGRSRRIYLARFDSKRRVLENEQTLARALEARGYAVLVMSELPPAEQLGYLRGARAVVAPHGGSLANLIAAEEQPSVVELFNPNRGTLAFAGLSQAVAARYHPIIGTPVARDARHRWTIHISDVVASDDGG
jgi:hypothetical protein